MARSRRGSVSEAICFGLAGLLVAVSVAGCWDDASTKDQIARELHTATLLADGRVLIAGGWDARIPAFAFSAELYDPKTGTFSPTGAMTAARCGHTATLLSDGRVLIAGGRYLAGRTSWLSVASAELYDPKTGTFSPTGSMATAREMHTATLLSDGRVLIAGGLGNSNDLITAELYDPATGTFSPTGSMPSERIDPAATLLSNGRVLFVGGDTPASLYDPATGTFGPTASVATTGRIRTATPLADGRVLVVGGDTSAELYDPKTGKFSPTGSMAIGHLQHTATLLADGRVLVVGSVASAEIYDPKTGKFSATGSMATVRQLHTATLLSDGRVLVAGGDNGVSESGSVLPSSLASVELYDPATGTFSLTGPMAPANS